MSFTVTDKRASAGYVEVKPVCRCCGSTTEHVKEYNKVSLECVAEFRRIIAEKDMIIHNMHNPIADKIRRTASGEIPPENYAAGIPEDRYLDRDIMSSY